MKSLDKETVNKALDLEEKLYVEVDKINDRIDFILKTLFGLFDIKLKTWYFEGAEEGNIGSPLPNMDHDHVYNIYVNTSGDSFKDVKFIDIYGNTFQFASLIPKRWLFDADFEKEIIDGVKKLEELKIKNKEKANLKKKKSLEEKSKLIQSVKSKLTPEELKAVLFK